MPDPVSVLLHTIHRPHQPGLGHDLTAQIRRWSGEVIRVRYQLVTLVEGVAFSIRWLQTDAAALRTAAQLGFDVSACQADVADPSCPATRYSISWEVDRAFVRAVVIAHEDPPREVHASPWTMHRSYAQEAADHWAQKNGLVSVASDAPDEPIQATADLQEG